MTRKLPIIKTESQSTTTSVGRLSLTDQELAISDKLITAIAPSYTSNKVRGDSFVALSNRARLRVIANLPINGRVLSEVVKGNSNIIIATMVGVVSRVKSAKATITATIEVEGLDELIGELS